MFESGFQELLDEFLLEARERADQVETLLLQLTSGSAKERSAALAQAKRELHTLKGNSGMMGFSNLQQLSHLMEDQVEELDLKAPVLDEILAKLDLLRHELEGIRATSAAAGAEEAARNDAEAQETEAAAADSTPEAIPHSWDTGGSVRVSFTKIDHLVELQAETLIFRNRLADAIERGLQLGHEATLDSELVGNCLASFEEIQLAQQALGKTLNMLQEQVMDLSLVPLQNLFRSLRRVVHDESNREGKQVELVISGGETPIDKTLLEAAAEALGHLVRNAVIHGIEKPAKRLRQGKAETGQVRLSATLEASEVRIEISDDGAGIDLAGLESRARGRNLMATGFALLFEEGLSTRGGADISAGRGVGLSAVKKSVERLGGRINVRSEPGRGTTFALRLPVTASILRSLLLSTDREVYALPLTAVAETIRLNGQGLHSLHDKSVTRWRGRTVSILDLGQLFGTNEGLRPEGFLVVIEINGRYRALAIDSIVGIHDIVVKGLDSIVGQPSGISGSTILGDGRVVMILDPASLATLPPSTIARETTA